METKEKKDQLHEELKITINIRIKLIKDG